MAFIKTHQPCLDPECGSSNGLSYNDNGTAKCFVCYKNFRASPDDKEYVVSNQKETTKNKSSPLNAETIEKLQSATYPSITLRGLSSATAKQYSLYKNDDGSIIQTYHNERGEPLATKTKTLDKDFLITGDWKGTHLFGQHLYPRGGRYLTITEGELDAAAAYQMQGSRYPCVSLRNGAGSALRDCKEQYDYIASFENVILCFDADEQGQKAAEEVGKLFGTKAKIVKHTGGNKDANDYLINGQVKEYNAAWWAAEYPRQGKVVDVHDFIERAMSKPQMGISSPWAAFNKACFGIRPHTSHVVGAAPKIGKTDHEHQLVHHLAYVEGVKVGMFDLENHPIGTAKKLASKEAKINFLRPDIEYDDDLLRSTLESLDGRVRFYDREGSRDWEDIKTAIIEMHFLDDINIFIIDPITALISNYTSSEANDKLNAICTDVADLVAKYPITLFFYSHVNPKPKTSKQHEQGAKVLSSEFTGSRAMEKWFHYGHGISRDRSDDCPEHLENISESYMIFDRDFGQHYHNYLYYDEKTVTYLETELAVEEL